MLVDHFVIRRGGFSGPRKYWAGFKLDDLGRCPRARPRSRWAVERDQAVQFVREGDAKDIIAALRLYRLNPSAVRVPAPTD